MIDFIFVHPELVSAEVREQSKEYFLNNLGPFREEFEEKQGEVTINFHLSPSDTNYFNYGFKDYDVFEFNHRFNSYKRDLLKE